MQVEISPTEATFVREAISAALKARPDLFDAEQVNTLTLVEHRLCHATDRALAERRAGELREAVELSQRALDRLAENG